MLRDIVIYLFSQKRDTIIDISCFNVILKKD